MPKFFKDGISCYIRDHKCLHGKCLTNADYEEVKSTYPDFVKVSLRIKSGRFEDKDPEPATGASDVYVMVKYVSSGHPGIPVGQVICQTWIVLDTDTPQWHDHFCFLPPMNRNSLLEFTAYDSDAPDEPEFLGSARIPLGKILNARNNFKVQLRSEEDNALRIGHIDVGARLM